MLKLFKRGPFYILQILTDQRINDAYHLFDLGVSFKFTAAIMNLTLSSTNLLVASNLAISVALVNCCATIRYVSLPIYTNCN